MSPRLDVSEKKSVHIRIPMEILAKLTAIVNTEFRTMSDVIMEAIRLYLNVKSEEDRVRLGKAIKWSWREKDDI